MITSKESGKVFSRALVVLKPLDHDFEYKLLFFNYLHLLSCYILISQFFLLSLDMRDLFIMHITFSVSIQWYSFKGLYVNMLGYNLVGNSCV